MKNKLEKTGHKRGYYKAKGFFGIFLFGILGLSLAAIPVGITYRIAETQAEAANASQSEDSQKEEDSSEAEEKGKIYFPEGIAQ